MPRCAVDDANCVEPDPPALTQAWNQRCVPMWIHRSDTLFSGSEMEDLVNRSFATWTNLECTDMELLFMGYTDQESGFDPGDPDDQKNVVLSTANAEALGASGPEVLAITLNSFSSATGEIFDADIVFNRAAAQFEVVDTVAACESRPAAERSFDIENTLTHEVGHFFGFDHVAITEATMLARANACEISKRDLANDDQLAMCTVYPAGLAPATCHPPASYDQGPGDPSTLRDQCERALADGCSCRTGGRTGGSTGWWAGLVLFVAWRLRRGPGRAASRPCAAPRGDARTRG